MDNRSSPREPLSLRAEWQLFLANFRLLPNQLSAIRLLAVAVMWVFAMRGQTVWVGIGLIICGLTDFLDGIAARRLNQVTPFGSKLDSIADQFLQLSSVAWVALLMPEIITENLWLALTALGLYFASLAVGLIKFGQVANLHLYLSKIGGLALYIFLLEAFLTGTYSQLLLWVAGGLLALSSAETLLLQLRTDQFDTEVGSILFLYLDDSHPLKRWVARLP